MTTKKVIPRALALRDVEAAVDDYGGQGDSALVDRFVASLQAGYRRIASRPKMGSPAPGFELDIPGLRCWRLVKFPYLVFYFERDDHIDVWRVLHARRDVPRAMGRTRDD